MKVMPPDDDRPPVSWPGALSRDELIEIVERIMKAEGTEAEQDHLIDLFEQSVPRPGATDLIFWPKGPTEPTAAEIVDEALVYKPIAL